MRAIVGVDMAGLYEAAMNLLGRLRFESIETELIHVDNPVPLVEAYPMALISDPEIEETLREGANRLLARACEKAEAKGLHPHSEFVVGPPSGVLMDRAQETAANLIAIGSTQKPKYGRFVLGSVGRALTIGSPTSLLVAKGKVAPEGDLTVVFATDHSSYADECVRLFARMHPQGIGRLVLLTAIDNESDRAEATEKSHSVVEHLREAGIPAEYEIVEGSVHAAIEESMQDLKADLLVLGAQGHGFIERMFVGSTSLQEVMASSHSVMVLRF